MNKKLLLIAILSSSMVSTEINATNPASIEYVQNYVRSQIANVVSLLTLTAGTGIAINSNVVSLATLNLRLCDEAEGGTIVYLTDDGQHGLVVANINSGAPAPGTNVTYYDAFNLATIPNYTAAQAYTDWKLPNDAQWEQICSSGCVPDLNFEEAAYRYWSSITTTPAPGASATQAHIYSVFSGGGGTCVAAGSANFAPDTDKRARAVRTF